MHQSLFLISPSLVSSPALWAALGTMVFLAACAFVVVDAFRRSALSGVLCLLVPFYILYFVFMRLRHPNRGGVVLTFLFAGALFLFGMARLSHVVYAWWLGTQLAGAS